MSKETISFCCVCSDPIHGVAEFPPTLTAGPLCDVCSEVRSWNLWWRSVIGEPVAVRERPWEKGGWLDPDGECWWCPPDGEPFWCMANPEMCDGGWVLPAQDLPVPLYEPLAAERPDPAA